MTTKGSSDEVRELSETALKQVLVGTLHYVLNPMFTNKKTIIYKDIQTTPHEAITKRAHEVRTRPHKHSIKSCICETHAMWASTHARCLRPYHVGRCGQNF